MSNQCADAWCAAQSAATEIACGAKEGDYLYRYDEGFPEEEPSEMVCHEIQVVLRGYGLRAEWDDTGLVVVLRDED
jgi:hypothetical protein